MDCFVNYNGNQGVWYGLLFDSSCCVGLALLMRVRCQKHYIFHQCLRELIIQDFKI